MNDAILMGIDKSEYQKKQLRTLVLSTNVNDYDTGEPIVDGSISKTLNSSSNLFVENPIFAILHSLKLGRKYQQTTMPNNNVTSGQIPRSQSKAEEIEQRQQRIQTICLYNGFITPKKD
jgi:hypothetical protein